MRRHVHSLGCCRLAAGLKFWVRFARGSWSRLRSKLRATATVTVTVTVIIEELKSKEEEEEEEEKEKEQESRAGQAGFPLPSPPFLSLIFSSRSIQSEAGCMRRVHESRTGHRRTGGNIWESVMSWGRIMCMPLFDPSSFFLRFGCFAWISMNESHCLRHRRGHGH